MASHATIDFLYDLLAGVHDGAIKEAVRASSMQAAKWMEPENMNSLRDLHRMLTAHREMVQIGEGAPLPETRTLQRYNSEAGDDDDRKASLVKERQDTWRQATALRKKFCTIAVCRAGKVADYAKVFEKTEAYRATASLKAAEAHRLFAFSAELWAEAPTQPWCNPPSVAGGADCAIQFIMSQRGPADILLFCDGRSRTCRATIEQLCGEARLAT